MNIERHMGETGRQMRHICKQGDIEEIKTGSNLLLGQRKAVRNFQLVSSLGPQQLTIYWQRVKVPTRQRRQKDAWKNRLKGQNVTTSETDGAEGTARSPRRYAK